MMEANKRNIVSKRAVASLIQEKTTLGRTWHSGSGCIELLRGAAL